MKKILLGLLGTSILLSPNYARANNGIYFQEVSPIEASLDQKEEEKSIMVAHAAGSIYGFRYTNSLEALEKSYENGHKYIEMDFEWTSDGVPVAIHDWDSMVRRLFMIEPRVLSYGEFKSLPTFQNLSLLDFQDLTAVLDEKKDLRIVTDIKNKNIEMLAYIARNHPDYIDRFIPQIYSFEEYNTVRDLGFKDIILTLYKYDLLEDISDEDIIEFTKNHELFALTMEINRAYTDLLPALYNQGLDVFVHTINDLYIYEELYKRGARGIYTDYFQPDYFPL